MNCDEFLDKQYEISVQAGMNQRYHQQRYATWWWRWDTSFKAATAALAVMGTMLSVAGLYRATLPEWNIAALVLSALSAIAAVILNVVPFGTWEQQHRDFLRQWTDLREDAEALLFECNGNQPNDFHIAELKKIDAKVHRLCGNEPSPDTKLLDKCYQSEKKSRQPAVAT